MNSQFSRRMAKATALTRAGRLHEATALIQALLHPGQARNVPPMAAAGAVIDGEYTLLAPDKPEKATARPKPGPLAETVRKIRAGGMPPKSARTGVAWQMPQGAQFLALTHSSDHGSRSYRLYVPAKPTQGPVPLIVMLHGCTQTPEDFAAGTGMNRIAEEFGFLIAYPAQPSGANMQKCWNWYRPEDQARGRGEPALIAGLTREILRDYPVDPAQVYVAGLSAGGAAAVVVAAAYPDIFSAVGVHSGLPAGGAHDIPSAFSAMRSGTRSKPHQSVVPTIVFHGLADTTVHPENGAAVLAQAVSAMPDLRVAERTGTSAGGRLFRTTAHLDAEGRSHAELWEIEGAGHAWAGGDPAGSHTDATGPDASRHMMRFFRQHKSPKKAKG